MNCKTGDKKLKIAINYFYLFEPGLDLSVLLFSRKNWPDIYLNSKAKYRYVIGNSNFAKTSDFSNYYFGMGLAVSMF